jgi:GNAT superfamily N-acetyltransferase
MDDATLAARQLRSQREMYRAMGSASPGARVVEAEGGVLAAVVPVRPDRSVVNAAVYEDGAALVAARDTLAAAYAEAGVFAWTVWTRPGDEEVPHALAAAGHRHDGQPMLMAAPIEEIDLEPRREFELEPAPAWADAARINDACYGLDPLHSFAEAFGDFDARLYVARLDGEPVACAGARWHEGDCGIYFVATLPHARGRGVAGELLRTALRDARAGGCETTSLEATALGAPVYERLGYRPLGRLGMWELRTGV